MSSFYVYWISSGSSTYIGATVDPTRRLRQHNGEIQGGAARTRNRGPWKFQCVISGFRTWKEALQFEWAFKYYTRGCRGVTSRKDALETLMQREKWTTNSPPSADVPLHIEHLPTAYGLPSNVVNESQRSVRKPQRKKQGFKTKLLGVTY